MRCWRQLTGQTVIVQLAQIRVYAVVVILREALIKVPDRVSGTCIDSSEVVPLLYDLAPAHRIQK